MEVVDAQAPLAPEGAEEVGGVVAGEGVDRLVHHGQRQFALHGLAAVVAWYTFIGDVVPGVNGPLPCGSMLTLNCLLDVSRHRLT